MGVKMAEFDGDIIFLELVQNGFCSLAIESFSAYNFSGNIFCKRRTIFKQFANIKNLSFANIYQFFPFDEAVKVGFILSCLLYYCE